MSIVFLSHYYSPRIGGVGKHVKKVAQQLINKNHQLTVITSQYDQHLLENEIRNRVKIIRVKLKDNDWKKPNKKKLWYWIYTNRKIFQTADVVHCHDVFFWYFPIKFLFPKIPVYITFHGYEGTCPPSQKAIAVRKISEKLSNGNICVGSFIPKWYGTCADYVTYGGVDLPRKITKINNYSALFLGRIEKDNGARIYFRAIDMLQKKINIKVEFCGNGTLKKEADKYGKVLGFRQDISSPLNRNRFAFVSSYLTILEAMVHKRIVFSVYGNELKNDYLTLSPFKSYINICKSPGDLVAKIQYFINHPRKEKELTEKAYQFASQYTWRRVSELYLKLWSS